PEPMATLQPMTPPALEMVVKSCLAKDPNERLQTAHDLKLQLSWTTQVSTAVKPPKASPKRKGWLPWAMVSLVALLAIVAAAQIWRRPAERVVHATILPPEKTTFEAIGDFGGPAVLSPDGEKIAFAAKGQDSPKALWVRALNSPTAQRLEGTEGASF